MWDSKRDTEIKNRLLDSVEEGKGGMIRETSTETCILPYVKQITSPGSMHETGHSGPVHWDDIGMGWGERWEDVQNQGTHVHPWLIHAIVWRKTLQYCQVIFILSSKHLWIFSWNCPFIDAHCSSGFQSTLKIIIKVNSWVQVKGKFVVFYILTYLFCNLGASYWFI